MLAVAPWPSASPFTDGERARTQREGQLSPGVLKIGPVADFNEEQMNSALRRASEELSFPSYYEACVRPLLRNPEGHWPRCCAGGCEPCAQTLIKVAQRTLEILGTPRVTPLPEW